MGLCYLDIANLRNITSASLVLSPSFNFLVGNNGSGKTTVLEAVYLLARGKSFRAKQLTQAVQTGKEGFVVFGRVDKSDLAGHADATEKEEARVGVAYRKDGLRIKVDGEDVKQSSKLARILPIVFISTDSARLISDSPLERRKFIDSGLFHVERDFHEVWQRFERGLRQRNAELRLNREIPQGVTPWDRELTVTATKLDELRKQYINKLEPVFLDYIEKMLSSDHKNIRLRYKRGWAQEEDDFGLVLKENFRRDQELGYTSRGPHRADVEVVVDGVLAERVVSGGQRKLLACALYLAQLAILRKNSGSRGALALVDDLPAELDAVHRKNFLRLLGEIGAQTLVTTTEVGLRDELAPEERQELVVFHVEQGQIDRSQ